MPTNHRNWFISWFIDSVYLQNSTDDFRLQQLQQMSIVRRAELLRAGLGRFDFPRQLPFCRTVCKQLEPVLDALQEIGRDEDKLLIEHYRWVFRLLRKHAKVLKAHGCIVDGCREDGARSLRGYKGEAPLYCAIWSGVDVPSLDRHHVQAKAQMVLAWSNLSTEKPWRCEELARSIEKLGSRKYRSLLSRLPDRPMTLEAYIETLRSVIEQSGAEPGLKYLKSMLKQLEVATGSRAAMEREVHGKRGRRGGGGGVAGIPPSLWALEPDGQMEFEYDDVERIEFYQPVRSFAGEDSHTADDFQAAVEAVLITLGDIDDQDLDPRMRALRQANIRNKVARHNQILPTDSQSLSVVEMAMLIQRLEDIAQVAFEQRKQRSFNLSAALTLVLFLGRSLEEVTNLHVYNVPVKLPRDCAVAYFKKERVFCVRPATPSLKTRRTEAEKQQAFPLVDDLWLEASEGLVQLMERMMSFECPQEGWAWLPFHEEKGEWGGWACDLMNDISETTGATLSLARVEKALFEHLCNRAGDIAVAAIISGRQDRRIASQLNYTTVSHKLLGVLYAETVNGLVGLTKTVLQRENAFLKTWSVKQAWRDRGWIGATFTPSPQTVQTLVKRMRRRLREVRQWRGIWILEYHNLYTVYTLLMLSYCTGIREMINPFFFREEFDLVRRAVLLTEKDRDDFYDTRDVPLTDLCVAQVEAYDDHRAAILSRLSRFNLPMALRIDQVDREVTIPRKRREYQAHRKHNIGYLFLFDEAGNVKPVTPSCVRVLIKDFFALPVRASRAYLRSMLLHERVLGEVIDTILGHGCMNTQALGEYSTVRYKTDVQNVARDAIDKIMNRDGWCIERSFINE